MDCYRSGLTKASNTSAVFEIGVPLPLKKSLTKSQTFFNNCSQM